MWSETFTDAYGWKWTFRKQSGPGGTPVQLLVSPPESQRGRLEPFSYGLAPEDLEPLARILEDARQNLAAELQEGEELAVGRDPRD